MSCDYSIRSYRRTYNEGSHFHIQIIKIIKTNCWLKKGKWRHTRNLDVQPVFYQYTSLLLFILMVILEIKDVYENIKKRKQQIMILVNKWYTPGTRMSIMLWDVYRYNTSYRKKIQMGVLFEKKNTNVGMSNENMFMKNKYLNHTT